MIEHQISKITSEFLLKRLFAIHAPSIAFDECRNARELADAIRSLAGYSLKQRDAIYVQLSTIDVIGSQPRQTDALQKMIKTESVLNERYVFADFGLPKGKKKEHSRIAHNIATWINIVAHSKSGEDDFSVGVVEAAGRIWARLEQQAVVISAQEGTCTFFLTPATKDLSTAEKSKLFEAEYKKYRTKVTGIKDYPAQVDSTVHTTFIRFSVNMAADPRLSVQVDENRSFVSLIDPNADKFKLDYFPGRDYVKMTRVVDRSTSLEIAQIFAEVVGAKIQDNRKKRCSFHLFDACRPKALSLSEDAVKRGDRVWISAIDSSYLDRGGNVVSKNREYAFPYYDDGDIYENLRKIKSDTSVSSHVEALAVKRETTGLDISFELHDFIETEKGQILFREDFMKPIVISVRPNGSNFLNKTKDLKPYHRNLILDVLARCDLLPKNRDQINIAES